MMEKRNIWVFRLKWRILILFLFFFKNTSCMRFCENIYMKYIFCEVYMVNKRVCVKKNISLSVPQETIIVVISRTSF